MVDPIEVGHAAEGAALRSLLVANGWRLRETAHAMARQISTLQRLLERHPAVDAERRGAIAARIEARAAQDQKAAASRAARRARGAQRRAR